MVVWFLVLLAVGIANQWLRAAWSTTSSTAVVLEQPLFTPPLRIHSWQGVVVPLDQRILEVAGTGDHCQAHPKAGDQSGLLDR